MRPSMLVTCPPLEIVTVPTPPKTPPTERSLLIVQVEPAPSTVTVPLPLNVPRKELPLETVPPLLMLRVPSPPVPLSSRRPVFVQLEPVPLTLTSPLLPGFIPIVLAKLETTWPPLEIVSVPAPDVPITNKVSTVKVEPTPSTVTAPVPFSPMDVSLKIETWPALVILSVALPSKPTKQPAVIVQIAPVPDTVAVPLDPRFSPMVERALETTPPFVMLRLPVPLLPTYRAPPSSRLPEPDVDNVPVSGAATPSSIRLAAAGLSVICAVPALLISAVVLESGTPADQFSRLNQFPVPSVQTVV